MFAVALLAVNLASVLLLSPGGQQRVKVPFSPYFLSAVQSGRVASIASKGDTIQGTFKSAVRYPASDTKANPTTLFATQVPSFWNDDQLAALLGSEGVEVNAQSTTQTTPLIVSVLLGFGPTLLIVGLFVLVARRAANSGGLGALGNFGRSKARRIDPATIRITFADVAGIDEAKSELTEIVDFLRNPDAVRPARRTHAAWRAAVRRAGHGQDAAGARRRRRGTRGVLLDLGLGVHRGDRRGGCFAGPGSVCQGQGSRAVDHLHRRARCDRTLPSGVGIDRGFQRRARADPQPDPHRDGRIRVGRGGRCARRDQPGEILDPALLRPGRFDRRVAVQPPDRLGRRQILEVHTRSIPLAAGVDLEALAATTPGMVGADLANLANEAALLAARRNHRTVQTADFNDSLEKILLGAPRGIVLSAADRERTAYHEAGHALVGMLTPGADPVRKVSIIPRGAALGVTLSAPDDDQVSYTREDLLAKIKVALGGRVAEEAVFGTISTGAESDIDQVTTIARQMVGRWGMSDAIGFVRVLPSDGRGSFFGSSGESSEATQRVLDEEVRRLIDAAHLDVTAALTAASGSTRDAGPGAAQDRDARRARRVRGSSDAAPDAGRRGVRGRWSARPRFSPDREPRSDAAMREAT